MSKVNLGEILADLQDQVSYLTARLQQLDPTVDWKPRTGPDRASRDPYASTVRWVTGAVADHIPYYDCYRVTLEGGGGVIMCGRAVQSGIAASGVVDGDTLGVGDRVLVAVHRGQRFGYITAVLPAAVLDRRTQLSDQVSQASPSARSADPFAVDLASRPTPDLHDFSGANPIDQSGVGEFHRGCAATGAAVHVDPYLTYLRTAEDVGVFMFSGDDTLRVAGRSLQTWTAGGEAYTWPDAAGGVTEYTGFTVFGYEADGAGAPGSTTHSSVPPAESQVTAPYKASAEPTHPDQEPVFRYTSLTGLAAAGRREQVTAPASAGLNRLSAPLPRTGFRDEVVGLDGGGFEVSAVGGERGLRPGLPAFVRTATPEAVTAPSAVPATQSPSGRLPDGIGSALVVDDLYAHRAWAAGRQMAAAGWADASLGGGEQAVDYAAVAADPAADPEPVPRPVTATTTVDTYPRASGVVTLPNGTLVLFGPCGEEIRLGGGVIELIAPTVTIRPGRDLLVLAGRDAVVRGHRDVELAAANGSVRVKAEQDLHALAGNSGVGSLLLEGRSDSVVQRFGRDGSNSAGGIILKTAGDLVQYSRATYAEAADGHVTKAASITQIADDMNRHVLTQCVDSYGPFDQPTSTSVFGPVTLLDGPLQVNGVMVTTGRAEFGDTVVVAKGHIITADADLYRGLVPGLDDETAKKLTDSLGELTDQAEERRRTVGDVYTAAVTVDLGGPYRPANPQTVENTAFGFRPSSAVGGVDQFVLYEGRWQQRARLTGQTTDGWVEPLVLGPDGVPTRPYPGNEIWSSACFRSVDLTLFDVTAGRPAADDGRYAAAVYPTPSAHTPEERLAVLS